MFSSFFSATRSLSSILILLLAVTACDNDEKLTEDILNERGKDIVRKSLIAPLKTDNEDNFELQGKLPRRVLLQVQHAPSSLTNPNFSSYLENRLKNEESDRASAADQDETSDYIAPVPVPEMNAAERSNVMKQRAKKRGGELVTHGLALEAELFEDIRLLNAKLEEMTRDTVAGLTAPPEIFGKNLTEDREGYLSIPADIVFVGGSNGTFASKTAAIKDQLNNPVISFSARDMPLANALEFLIKTIGLQATISDQILQSDKRVSLSVRAGVLAILDGVMSQHNLAIIYDPSIEVAQIYADDELRVRMDNMRAAIEGYNQTLFKRRQLDIAKQDQQRLSDMVKLSQLLLGADDKGFLRGVETMSRAPGGTIIGDALNRMTAKARLIDTRMTQFDAQTARLLAPRRTVGQGSFADAVQLASMKNLLLEDACVIPNREILTEKISVYNAPISGDSGIIKKINDFFAMTRGDNQSDNATISTDAGSSTTPDTIEDLADANCPSGDPAPPRPLMLEDETGMVITGTRRDNDLLVKLVEQFDVPNLQVLIEIFMITVSKDFSRQIDSLLTINPAGGGNNVQEATLSEVSAAAEAAGGSFKLQLKSPNEELFNLINFLEQKKLARLVSSPTILVADGETATISRTQTARVLRQEQTAKDNQTVTNTYVDEYQAPFALTIGGVRINRINKTVRLEVRLEDTRFASSLALVGRDTDETTDLIDTSFWSAPGDVVVLAGLTRNTEGSTTTGIPGTTGTLAPITPLLGGSDAISNELSETMIFMAPTVIDPSASTQPHSAFRKIDYEADKPSTSPSGTPNN